MTEIDSQDENAPAPAVRIPHGPDHLSEQDVESIEVDLQNIIVTSEEDVSVELLGSPRREG